ncbi:MAG: deoxyguanosinetriphosphate triphosphohydrolase [Peptoniphilus sp.]|nr:deoxyguanosinetriphosphate triphosphohydrolase [Peptoniphilus sp.]MDD7362734.1 deoxyguanosinetriphosphate triphosphohydrolase [Bacillota bacterium]MDY6044572.1 deoxyguanosinetriphosphate triphosphohydrolase [Peptoniphilus sp.]
MLLRERWEQVEEVILSDRAAHSVDSKGRRQAEAPCDLRTCYQRDRDRILHSKAFRRLKHKTHVFIAPEGDHYRTRLTHTLEVAQIARTMARGLRLNEDLVEAIALGHDLGHTPFGHSGEAVLDQLHPDGFDHAKHSLRVVDLLESKPGREGLNLTWEVRDGILHHSKEQKDNPAHTLEGQIIKFADRIAYLNHDIDDSVRAGVLTPEDIPKHVVDTLGASHSERITTLVRSVIESSGEGEYIAMDPVVYDAMIALREFMFERVYYNPAVKSEDGKVGRLIVDLFTYFKKHLDAIPEEHLAFAERHNVSDDDIVTDYIAGMTDRFAINIWKQLFVPKDWHSL